MGAGRNVQKYRRIWSVLRPASFLALAVASSAYTIWASSRAARAEFPEPPAALPPAAFARSLRASLDPGVALGGSAAFAVEPAVARLAPPEAPQASPTPRNAPNGEGATAEEKDLIVYAHLHGSGGKEICAWARRASADPGSGVKLDPNQMATAVCNTFDPDPPENWLKERIRTCEDFRRFVKHYGGSTFQFIETLLDVRPPCPGMTFVLVIRQPWRRMESTQVKMHSHYANASAVIRRMHKKGNVQDSITGWNYCNTYHAPTCNPFLRAGYFNNYYIRYLLGWEEGAHVPWDEIGEEHFEKAKRILELFDVVVPLDYLADALPVIQCAAGRRFRLGVHGIEGGLYGWTKMRRNTDVAKAKQCIFRKPCDIATRKPFCELFQEYNQWDIKLYDWALARWEQRVGRCLSSGTLPAVEPPPEAPPASEKDLIIFPQFHAAGGKDVCDWARRAMSDNASGVELSRAQQGTGACNTLDAAPPDNWLCENLHSCEDMRDWIRESGATSFQFTETPLDVKPKCPRVGFFTVVQQPWARMESVQYRLGGKYAEATAVIKRMSAGGNPLDDATGWDYCGVSHSPTCQPFFKAGYFNNFYIRMLLGSAEGPHVPWDGIGEEHFYRAKQILEDFDLVVPIDRLAEALPALQCVAGKRYDFGLSSATAQKGGKYAWPQNFMSLPWHSADCTFPADGSPLSQARLDFCKAFKAHNTWDQKLYEWVLERWLLQRAGRCWNSETAPKFLQELGVEQAPPTHSPRANNLMVFAHFHSAGGKEMCYFARRAMRDPQSGVKLDKFQQVTGACNQVDPDPPENWLAQKVRSCDDMRRYSAQQGVSTFQFIETAQDVRGPCPGMGMITILRQPWARMECSQAKIHMYHRNATAVIKGMRQGADPLDDATGWNYCSPYHAPTCQPQFKAGYFNNFYVRYLLGLQEGAVIPWGEVSEAHYEKAKSILENFDLVIPIDYLADALPAVQCAFGPNYDLGVTGAPGGRYDWTQNRKLSDPKRGRCEFEPDGKPGTPEKLELCRVWKSHNTWDQKLWEWALSRWVERRAGRCWNETHEYSKPPALDLPKHEDANDLVVYQHIHGAGGEWLCYWARRAMVNTSSGVILDSHQKVTGACNQVDPDPPQQWLDQSVHNCDDLRRYSKQEGLSTFQFIETAHDARAPCPRVAFWTVLRQPWDRIEYCQSKSTWLVPNASALMMRMRKGDDVLADGTGWNYCSVHHAPTCQPHFKAGYFNNFYVRYLLGLADGAPIPWDEVGEEHFELAKRILESFALVIPFDNVGSALPDLQCAIGVNYDLGVTESKAGRYDWPNFPGPADETRGRCGFQSDGSQKENERLEFCKLFVAHNEWDIKLWDWAVTRWRARRQGCTGQVRTE